MYQNFIPFCSLAWAIFITKKVEIKWIPCGVLKRPLQSSAANATTDVHLGSLAQDETGQDLMEVIKLLLSLHKFSVSWDRATEGACARM